MDNDCDCPDRDREENLNPDFCDGESWLWLNAANSNIDPETLECTINCNNGIFIDSDDCELEFIDCCPAPDAKWCRYDLTYPDVDDARCTITVTSTDFSGNQVVGKDSWRQDCPL